MGRAELAGLRLLALMTCHLTAPPASWEGGGELLISTMEQQGSSDSSTTPPQGREKSGPPKHPGCLDRLMLLAKGSRPEPSQPSRAAEGH